MHDDKIHACKGTHEMLAPLFAIGYDPSRFFANLSTGDPIAWFIMAGIVGFSLFSVYQCMPQRS